MTQVRDAVTRKCSNCGGGLEAGPEGPRAVGRYCGAAFQAPPQMPPPPRIVVIQPGRHAQPPAVVGRAARAALTAFAMMFALGIAVFLASSRAGRSSPSLTTLPSFPSGVVQALGG